MAANKSWRWLPSKGWLPINSELDRSPVRLEWLEIGPAPLKDPFFFQTVARVRAVDKGNPVITTDFETLLQAGRQGPAVNPSGIIFHLSRCGSTMITNYLKLAMNAIVVSESNIAINFLHPSFVLRGNEAKAAMCAQGIRAFVNILAGCHGDARGKVVLKMSSINLLSLSVARAWWPDTPFVVLVRDPVSVIASNVTRRGPWLDGRGSRLAERAFPWMPRNPYELSDVEFCARAIGDFCEAALSAYDHKCMLVDYEDIDITTLSRIGRFCGLAIPPDDDEIVMTVLTSYSKDPSGRRPFRAIDKQDVPVNPVILDAARRWAMGPYLRLRQSSPASQGPAGCHSKGLA
jgi:hypothetical protein